MDGGKLPKRQQAAGKTLLCEILSAETRWEAERYRDQFARWCVQRGCPNAAQCLEADWERMVTCCRFPRAHWQHLRTTNSAESTFAAARLRTDAATRLRKAQKATVGIWKRLFVVKRVFRRLNHPRLMRQVYRGAQDIDGIQVNT